MNRAAFFAVCCLLAAASCGPPSVQERWFYERGVAGDSTSCVEMATALRAECAGNARCQREVSRNFSRHCYIGVYQRRGERRLETDLGPCFWDVQTDPDKPADGRPPLSDFARDYCARLEIAESASRHCQLEVAFAVRKLCTDPDSGLPRKPE